MGRSSTPSNFDVHDDEDDLRLQSTSLLLARRSASVLGVPESALTECEPVTGFPEDVTTAGAPAWDAVRTCLTQTGVEHLSVFVYDDVSLSQLVAAMDRVQRVQLHRDPNEALFIHLGGRAAIERERLAEMPSPVE